MHELFTVERIVQKWTSSSSSSTKFSLQSSGHTHTHTSATAATAVLALRLFFSLSFFSSFSSFLGPLAEVWQNSPHLLHTVRKVERKARKWQHGMQIHGTIHVYGKENRFYLVAIERWHGIRGDSINSCARFVLSLCWHSLAPPSVCRDICADLLVLPACLTGSTPPHRPLFCCPLLLPLLLHNYRTTALLQQKQNCHSRKRVKPTRTNERSDTN